MNDLAPAWLVFNEKWLQFDGAIYVIRYEHLKNHLTDSVLDLCRFLGIDVSKDVMECVRNNTEGVYHRRSVSQPLLTVQEKENIRFLLELQNRTLFTDVRTHCPLCTWNRQLWGQ